MAQMSQMTHLGFSVNSVVSLDELMRGEENLTFYTVTRSTRQMRRRWRQTRRGWRQIRRILKRFYGVTEGVRPERVPIKKIKNKNDVSLYFLLRVCFFSSKFVSTLQGRWTLDLLTPWPRPHSHFKIRPLISKIVADKISISNEIPQILHIHNNHKF